MRCRVKICGVTCVEDADRAVQLGADALGVNLIPSSQRYVEREVARAIVEQVRGRVMTIAVLANPSVEMAGELQADLGFEQLQLHGDEPPELLQKLGPSAFKAVRIRAANDVALARSYPGELLLVDAKVEGVLGGSGVSFDWALVSELARERNLIVAGGLNPGNVARAVSLLRPWAVDVASGVELAGDPRRKSPELMAQFLTAVRGAVTQA